MMSFVLPTHPVMTTHLLQVPEPGTSGSDAAGARQAGTRSIGVILRVAFCLERAGAVVSRQTSRGSDYLEASRQQLGNGESAV